MTRQGSVRDVDACAGDNPFEPSPDVDAVPRADPLDPVLDVNPGHFSTDPPVGNVDLSLSRKTQKPTEPRLTSGNAAPPRSGLAKKAHPRD
jgi:hypothetical protein